MLGIDHTLIGWSAAANLHEFGHVAAAAFEVNLGYSILLKLGQFSHDRVSKWVDNEKLRILPVMAEKPEFDGDKFKKDVDTLETRFKKIIGFTNTIAIIWAMIAATITLLLICATPFCDNCMVQGAQALDWELFLIGATPTGIAIFCIYHLIAIAVMRANSWGFDGVIKYNKSSVEKITNLRSELKRELAAARAEQA